MSNIEKLIAEKCPDGVEYKKLDELLDYEQPTKYIVSSTEYDDSYETPVLTAGQSFVLGYTNETLGIYDASKDNPVIIFDDFTTSFHWVDFPFKVKSSAMKMLNPKDEKNIDFKYVYYAMTTLKYEPSEHSRQWIGTYSQFEIPVPPIEVQQEIVRILDKFTELEAKLTEELEMRKKQYGYVMDSLLTMKDADLLMLGDIGRVKMCKRILKQQTQSSGDIPFYKIGTFGSAPDAFISRELFEEYKQKYSYPKKGNILISASGTIGRTVVFNGEDSYFQDSNIVWLEHDGTKVIDSYLEYIYKTSPWKVSDGGTISRLYNDNIISAVIPVPSLEEQERIVKILDSLNTLCNDTEKGLPAEIAARHKQYEYYRDKILTFEREAV